MKHKLEGWTGSSKRFCRAVLEGKKRREGRRRSLLIQQANPESCSGLQLSFEHDLERFSLAFSAYIFRSQHIPLCIYLKLSVLQASSINALDICIPSFYFASINSLLSNCTSTTRHLQVLAEFLRILPRQALPTILLHLIFGSLAVTRLATILPHPLPLLDPC